MKKIDLKTMATLFLIAAWVLTPGIIFAFDKNEKSHNRSHQPQPRSDKPLGLMTKFIHEGMVLQSLSRITGQSDESLEKELKEKNLKDVLGEYGIDRKIFHEEMAVRMKNLIRKAGECELINQEQASIILQKMEEHTSRDMILKKLIEKGIEDKTITTEEAMKFFPPAH